ncbi:putative ras GTPase-activating protein [Paratrimastix pyriformis]|uniref:Ras GTPase-activating protein n=1 Tax=Paratrimastix pyriformis TaxID=342808 RepID=A0ABQ8UUY4_9EUKA|nr:putative ras GTPase-activating protein [Paratrimastix pyriformis]
MCLASSSRAHWEAGEKKPFTRSVSNPAERMGQKREEGGVGRGHHECNGAGGALGGRNPSRSSNVDPGVPTAWEALVHLQRILQEEKQTEEQFNLDTEILPQLQQHLSSLYLQRFSLTQELHNIEVKIGIWANQEQKGTRTLSLDEFARSIEESVRCFQVSHNPFGARKAAYCRLIAILRHCPYFLARMGRQLLKVTELDSFVQTCAFSLFGDLFNKAEDALLLQMISHIIDLDMKAARDPPNLLRQTSFLTKLLSTYVKRSGGRQYLRETLSPILLSIIRTSDRQNSQGTHPASTPGAQPPDQWAWLRRKEGRDDALEPEELGSPSGLPPMREGEVLELEVDPINVARELHPTLNFNTNEEAMEMADVHDIVTARLPLLEAAVRHVLGRIFRSASVMPLGVRWLAKQLARAWDAREPGNLEGRNALVGGFIFLRLFTPAIFTPDALGLHAPRLLRPSAGTSDSAVAAGPLADAVVIGVTGRRNLTLVAKVLQALANRQSVDTTASRMTRESFLDPVVARLSPWAHPLIASFLQDLIDVADDVVAPTPDAVPATSLSVAITPNEVYTLHRLLEQALAADGPPEEDATSLPPATVLEPLRATIAGLGPAPGPTNKPENRLVLVDVPLPPGCPRGTSMPGGDGAGWTQDQADQICGLCRADAAAASARRESGAAPPGSPLSTPVRPIGAQGERPPTPSSSPPPPQPRSSGGAGGMVADLRRRLIMVLTALPPLQPLLRFMAALLVRSSHHHALEDFPEGFFTSIPLSPTSPAAREHASHPTAQQPEQPVFAPPASHVPLLQLLEALQYRAQPETSFLLPEDEVDELLEDAHALLGESGVACEGLVQGMAREAAGRLAQRMLTRRSVVDLTALVDEAEERVMQLHEEKARHLATLLRAQYDAFQSHAHPSDSAPAQPAPSSSSAGAPTKRGAFAALTSALIHIARGSGTAASTAAAGSVGPPAIVGPIRTAARDLYRQGICVDCPHPTPGQEPMGTLVSRVDVELFSARPGSAFLLVMERDPLVLESCKTPSCKTSLARPLLRHLVPLARPPSCKTPPLKTSWTSCKTHKRSPPSLGIPTRHHTP